MTSNQLTMILLIALAIVALADSYIFAITREAYSIIQKP